MYFPRLNFLFAQIQENKEIDNGMVKERVKWF